MHGPKIRRGSIRTTMTLVATIATATAVSACGEISNSAFSTAGADEPVVAGNATNPPTNIVDELVRNTVEGTGLDAPYEVVEVREGRLDELMGITPEAAASASIAPRQSGRRNLERRAWRVRVIGGDGNVVCITDPCIRPRIYVEAYLEGVKPHTIIGTTVGPVPAQYASPAP